MLIEELAEIYIFGHFWCLVILCSFEEWHDSLGF